MRIPLPQPHHLGRAAIVLILGTMIATVESKSMIGAYHAQADQIAGIQMAMISGLCAALAFAGFTLVGLFKDDIRPQVRKRVFATRAIAVLFMIVPIGFLGSSLKTDRLEAHYAAYQASPAFAADARIIADPMADTYEKDAARERNARPVTPDLTVLDGEFWIAFFLLTLLNFAGEALRIPAPVTAEEREHIRRCEIAAKGAATRRRNKARRDAAKDRREGKQPQRRQGFNILQGGKR